MRELGRRIRARRIKLGLSQEFVATSVGKSRTWLVAIEKGAGNPKAEDLAGLATTLSEDPAEYLRLAGRTVLRAEGVTPLPALDPRMTQAIDEAVNRAFDRLTDRLIDLLDGRSPGDAPRASR